MVPVFQEGFEERDRDAPLDAPEESLLEFDGIQLLDKKNVYQEEAVRQLAEIVIKTIARSSR